MARDSRAGYYAGAETLPMVRFFPAARRPPSLADLQRVVAAERPDAVVLVVDDAAGQELSRAFARATGLEPARLRPERAVALDVFLLSPR